MTIPDQLESKKHFLKILRFKHILCQSSKGSFSGLFPDLKCTMWDFSGEKVKPFSDMNLLNLSNFYWYSFLMLSTDSETFFMSL